MASIRPRRTENGISQESDGSKNRRAAEQGTGNPSTPVVSFPENRDQADSEEQKGEAKNTKADSLNWLCVWVTFPKKLIDAPAALVRVFPENCFLSFLDICSNLLKAGFFSHNLHSLSQNY
jgi:hypothetical protein